MDAGQCDEVIQFCVLGWIGRFQGVLRNEVDQTQLFDSPIEDTEAAMIHGSQGLVSPSVDEVIFPIEEIHFIHEILGNMMI